MATKRKAAVAPFRVYSGWDSRQAEAAEVFVASLMAHASVPVEHRFVSADPACPGGSVCARSAVTSFTYARFMCPHLAGFAGKALWLDGCDMLCLGDVDELRAFADYDMDGEVVKVVKHEFHGQARPRSWSSLMIMDCSRLTAWTPEFVESAPDEVLMRFGLLTDDQIGELPVIWNQLVQPGEEPPEGTKVAHYSALSSPDIGPWIDASGSQIWMAARERWRVAR